MNTPHPLQSLQRLALAVILANLALVLLFPPYDYLSMQRGNVPTFDGFHWLFAEHGNRRLNSDLLTIEVIVLLINGAIAWLLLHERGIGQPQPGGNRFQRGVLWFVAINLLVIALFPPFQNYTAISKAALPSFEGFYFLFADNSQRQLVGPILYLEAGLVLINGGMLWLLFKGRGQEKLSANDIRALASSLQSVQSAPPR